MMFAGTIIAYNTNLVKTPPASWADVWKAEFKGKLAIPDISGTSGQQFLMAAARLHGGSLENIDPGFEGEEEGILYADVDLEAVRRFPGYFYRAVPATSITGTASTPRP
jgi:spermidine/putrescine-binding protein